MAAVTLSPPRSCQLSLIGGFELRVDGSPCAARDTGARLLTLLAVTSRRRGLTRQVAAERLWAEDAERSSARLRNALWRLPRSAHHGPIVRVANSTLALAEHVEVDLWSAEADARTLRGAVPGGEGANGRESGHLDLARFAHDLLPEWSEDWLVLEREAFRQTRLHALEAASAQLLARGFYEAALQAALTAVACEPLRETAHCRVIEVHLAEGNPAEALRQYQHYRRTLSTRLGLVPTQKIRTLVGPLLNRPADHRPRGFKPKRGNR